MNPPAENDLNSVDPRQFELEDFLPYRLSLLTNTISQGMAQSYRNRHNISVPEWRVLAVLGRFPGLTASEVAERTAMDKVAISRAVKGLETRGLLERRTDAGDRRRQNLVITLGAGQDVLRDVIPMAQRYETELLGPLDSSELTQLLKLITKLQVSALALNASPQQAKNTGNKKSRE